LDTETTLLGSAARKLAPYYGKLYGTLTATGMAALEISLEWVGVVPNDEVIVPIDCCYLIPAAVRRLRAVPVFAAIDQHLTLDPMRLYKVINDKTRTVITVHHLGLPCPIQLVREAVPSHIPIIEDAAQAFALFSMYQPIGTFAEIVVTSMGARKPLSLGGGGGIFTEQPSIVSAMERHGKIAREGDRLPHSAALHPRAVEDLDSQLKLAQKRISLRRDIVSTLSKILEGIGFDVWKGRMGDQPSWHRLPVWPRTMEIRQRALASPAAERVVQTPHKIPVFKLPLFLKNSRIDYSSMLPKPLLIRLDDPESLEIWIKGLT